MDAAVYTVEVTGHHEVGWHRMYVMEGTAGGAPWRAEKSLSELRTIHDRVIAEVGRARYDSLFVDASFASRVGLPGTTAKLNRWFKRLFEAFGDRTLPSDLREFVLDFLGVPLPEAIPQLVSLRSAAPERNLSQSTAWWISVTAVVAALFAGLLHSHVNRAAGNAEDASVLLCAGGHGLDRDGDGDVDAWDMLLQLDGEFQPGAPAYQDSAWDVATAVSPFLVPAAERDATWWALLPFRLAHRLLVNVGVIVRVVFGLALYVTGAFLFFFIVTGKLYELQRRVDADVDAYMHSPDVKPSDDEKKSGVVERAVNAAINAMMAMLVKIMFLPFVLMGSLLAHMIEIFLEFIPLFAASLAIHFVLPPHIVALSFTFFKCLGFVFYVGLLWVVPHRLVLSSSSRCLR